MPAVKASHNKKPVAQVPAAPERFELPSHEPRHLKTGFFELGKERRPILLCDASEGRACRVSRNLPMTTPRTRFTFSQSRVS
ncbi:MAG: hypothetical protein B7733_22545 [Myxococcales bacterium FL481]|nr:MAG: hypothetical protein B7733_22545 [Myxococcales bacterium FL481]